MPRWLVEIAIGAKAEKNVIAPTEPDATETAVKEVSYGLRGTNFIITDVRTTRVSENTPVPPPREPED